MARMACSSYVGGSTVGLMLDISFRKSDVWVGLAKGMVGRRSAVMVSRRSKLRGSGQLMVCASARASEGTTRVGLESKESSEGSCWIVLVSLTISTVVEERGLVVRWLLMLTLKGGYA